MYNDQTVKGLEGVTSDTPTISSDKGHICLSLLILYLTVKVKYVCTFKNLCSMHKSSAYSILATLTSKNSTTAHVIAYDAFLLYTMISQ